jgi:SAM-dependent methyltransferase
MGAWPLGQPTSARGCMDYHLFWPDRSYKEDFSILVAGCGTSQAAKHALRWPAARVTGIDISETSVRCTEELKRKHNLTNLEVYQLPIGGVTELGTAFDQIVCTGVLHHLANPDAGLSALREVLKPHGAMHLMVYAPYGRAGIYMVQEFCRRVGIGPTDEGIVDLILALRALPPGHPLETVLREAPISSRRQLWPTRCSTRRTARILCRGYCTLSSGQDSHSAGGLNRRLILLTVV